MSYNHLVKELFKAAKEQGVTIREVERRAGLGDNVISCWKRNREPLAGNLLAALGVLGLTVEVRGEVTDGE